MPFLATVVAHISLLGLALAPFPDLSFSFLLLAFVHLCFSFAFNIASKPLVVWCNRRYLLGVFVQKTPKTASCSCTFSSGYFSCNLRLKIHKLSCRLRCFGG